MASSHTAGGFCPADGWDCMRLMRSATATSMVSCAWVKGAGPKLLLLLLSGCGCGCGAATTSGNVASQKRFTHCF